MLTQNKAVLNNIMEYKIYRGDYKKLFKKEKNINTNSFTYLLRNNIKWI